MKLMKKTLDRSSAEKLVKELRSALEDAEGLLQATATEVDRSLEDAWLRVEQSVGDVHEGLLSKVGHLRDRTVDVVKDADRFVRRHPWQTIGAIAGVTLLAGLLIGRRRR